jgi:GAF domain-containing protein
MSSKNRKYKRIDALFAGSPPAAPDSPEPAAAKPPLPAPRTAEEAGESRSAAPNALTVPLKVGGETVGAVRAAGAGSWTEREVKIANGVAERLARHLENIMATKGTKGTQ